MGEIADWINEQFYDPFIDGPIDYSLRDNDNGPSSISCKYCNFGPLWWIETNSGFRLVSRNNQIHSCEEYSNERNAIPRQR